ncbi:MAG: ABC transporter substrate-binding protein, partial [Bacteroidales bacterium]|nr:ABC transporter substrate-binding protein [Bacteroidales bacterium]
IDNMKQKLADIEKNIDNSKKPSVYYVAGFGETGDYTAGGNTFINDIIRLAGGENLAKDLNGWAISKEAIFARQPDFIIVRQEDLNTFKSTAPYNKLKAVIENRVLGIESSLTDCQTLRSVEAIKQINDFISKNQ